MFFGLAGVVRYVVEKRQLGGGEDFVDRSTREMGEVIVFEYSKSSNERNYRVREVWLTKGVVMEVHAHYHFD